MSPLPSDRMQAALLRALAPWGPFALLGARTVPWMSGTFEGARHRLALRIEGDGAAARAERLRAELGEAELPIRGGFVADVVVTARLDSEAPIVAIEALTIDDSEEASAVQPRREASRLSSSSAALRSAEAVRGRP